MATRCARLRGVTKRDTSNPSIGPSQSRSCATDANETADTPFGDDGSSPRLRVLCPAKRQPGRLFSRLSLFRYRLAGIVRRCTREDVWLPPTAGQAVSLCGLLQNGRGSLYGVACTGLPAESRESQECSE